jgi:prolyl-tRNA synthetase
MDLRQVEPEDGCINCGSPLEIRKTVEIGHIFKLGYKYSESMGLHVTNAEGADVTPIMGSYGIGIERILSAAIELYHDKDGMSLPPAIAPFAVVVTPVNMADAAQAKASDEIYRACKDLGLDTLLDDRDERPGVKFKDADLIGVPFRITVGKKVGAGMVELVERRTRKTVDVLVGEVARRVKGL